MLDMDWKRKLGIVVILLSVIMLWAGSAYVISILIPDPAERGTAGDMFGAINALFSGLAFAFVVYAILLQQQDLRMQKLELELTRKELSKSARAQANSHVFAALATLSSRWNSLPMFRARQMVASRFQEANGELEEGVWEIIAEFFEHLGACVRAEAISKELVWDAYTWYIENYWLIIKPTVLKLREKDNDPTYYERFEELYEEMMVITRKRLGDKYGRATMTLNLDQFCLDEKNLAKAGVGVSTG